MAFCLKMLYFAFSTAMHTCISEFHNLTPPKFPWKDRKLKETKSSAEILIRFQIGAFYLID